MTAVDVVASAADVVADVVDSAAVTAVGAAADSAAGGEADEEALLVAEVSRAPFDSLASHT